MCMYCHSFPHLSGCPNEPEPKAVYTCSYCKEGILDGDECVEVDGCYYHVSCLSDEMTIYEVLNLFGCEYEVARDDA